MLIVKSPVRISFSGGGTDLPDFFKKFGGAVLSTTINKHFYSVLTPRKGKDINIKSLDYNVEEQFGRIKRVAVAEPLRLPKAIVKYFRIKKGFTLSLNSDIPLGSGLGLSGAVTTNLVKSLSMYSERNMLSKEKIADIATRIEIGLLKRPIGLQDQYASSFGGFNFIEFDKHGVKVIPIKNKGNILDKLEEKLLLFYTGTSRDSADILKRQRELIKKEDRATIDSLKRMVDFAYQMKKLLERGNLHGFGQLLDKSWVFKKGISNKISNNYIDRYYHIARENGAVGGKITGAGGGGFLLLYCEERKQEEVKQALGNEGLIHMPFKFERDGVQVILDNLGFFNPSVTTEGYLLGIDSVVKMLDQKKIDRIIDILFDAYKKDKQVFVMGNGGSAATASHFCNDLSKTVQSTGKKGFRALPLTDNVSLMTAWGNDTSFENIFYGQLVNLLNPGDVVIGISGGGNSSNVIKAIKYANNNKATTIGLLGYSGGKLMPLARENILVPIDNYQFIEDVHLIVIHLIISVLREKIKNEL